VFLDVDLTFWGWGSGGGGQGGEVRFPICGSEFVKGLPSLRVKIDQDQVTYSTHSRVRGHNHVVVNLALHKGKQCKSCFTQRLMLPLLYHA